MMERRITPKARVRPLGVVIIFYEFFNQAIPVLLVDRNNMIQKLSP
jgi:hypothetical protein